MFLTSDAGTRLFPDHGRWSRSFDETFSLSPEEEIVFKFIQFGTRKSMLSFIVEAITYKFMSLDIN